MDRRQYGKDATISSAQPGAAGAGAGGPGGPLGEPLALSGRGRPAPGHGPGQGQPVAARLCAGLGEDHAPAAVQPLRGQDPGVLLLRERRHHPPGPPCAAGVPHRQEHRGGAGPEPGPDRGHRPGARPGPHPLRPRGGAVFKRLVPGAHRPVLQPQRPLRAGAGRHLPPERGFADPGRHPVPQRGVRAAGVPPRAPCRLRRVRRPGGGLLHPGGGGHQKAGALHPGGLRGAGVRHDRLPGQGPPGRHDCPYHRRENPLHHPGHRHRQRRHHQQHDRGHSGEQLREGLYPPKSPDLPGLKDRQAGEQREDLPEPGGKRGL